jgi:hypothetical protein
LYKPANTPALFCGHSKPPNAHDSDSAVERDGHIHRYSAGTGGNEQREAEWCDGEELLRLKRRNVAVNPANELQPNACRLLAHAAMMANAANVWNGWKADIAESAEKASAGRIRLLEIVRESGTTQRSNAIFSPFDLGRHILEVRMELRSKGARSAVAKAACWAVPVLAIHNFLRDVLNSNWTAWEVSPLLVLAFLAATLVRKDSEARPILLLAALIVGLFIGVYDILDGIIGPDRPVWIVTPPLVIALWLATSALLEEEED